MPRRKLIIDFPDYVININGFVYRVGSCTPLKPSLNTGGYKFVGLYRNKKRFHKPIHRLLLETFAGPCPEGMECRHLDGNPLNNNLINLRWGTKSSNSHDMVKHGRCQLSKNRGEKHYNVKLTEQDIVNITYLWNTKLFKQRDLANLYNINQSTISRIINGKRWKHLWQE